MQLVTWYMPAERQEKRTIAERTARCRCKFGYVSNFTTAS